MREKGFRLTALTLSRNLLHSLLMRDQTMQRLLRAWQKIEQDYQRVERDRESIQRALSLAGISISELQADPSKMEEAESTPSSTQEGEDPSLQAGATTLRTRNDSENGQVKIRITQEIRKAVAEFEDEFTQQDILIKIAERYPNAKVRAGTISSTLWRLASKGEIEKVRDGYGSEPNTYRRVSSTTLQEGFPEESESDEEDTDVEREAMS